MQTILGAGGAIGTELAKNLQNHTSGIRLVNRNPRRVHPDDVLMAADLTDRRQLFRAVEGSEIVYMCAGLKYDTKTWRNSWPEIIKNLIDACETYGAKLVFTDNVYAIGANHIGHMTENSPMHPTSKKGEIRAGLNRMILAAADSGKIQAIIARCADFYGPYPDKSVPMVTVYGNLIRDKKAQWLFDAGVPHTYTYTKDAGKALAMLGNAPDAYGRIWNLPTARPGITGSEFITLMADAMGKKPAFTLIPSWIIKGMGLFLPVMRELHEMGYQFDREYLLDSSEFEQRFQFKPTPYEQGIRETVEELRKSSPASLPTQ